MESFGRGALGVRAKRAGAAAIAVALGGVAAAIPACYGPTEVRVVVTTTAACDAGTMRGLAPGIETQLFTGTRGDTFFELDPTAETRECSPSGEPRIGTLSVVPSGDREGRFDLEVIAGVGVAASSCRASGFKNCIVARRRITFRPHQSLEVPVLLSDRCIDKPCGSDESCDLGECAKIEDCTENGGCPRERGEVPPAVARPEADASVDAPVLDAGPDVDGEVLRSCGPTPEVVVSGQKIVGPLAIEGADFVYANVPTAAAAEIRRVNRRGGPHTVVRAVPSLRAVTAGGSAVAWVQGGSDAAQYLRMPNGTNLATTSGVQSRSSDAIALSGFGIVGMASMGTGSNGFAVVGSTFTLQVGNFPGARSAEVLVDEDGDWFTVVGGGLIHYQFDGTQSVLADYYTVGVPSPDIAVADRTVFVRFASSATGAGIHRIPRAQITPSYAGQPFIPDVAADSLATDGIKLYWLAGTALARVGLLAGDPPIPESLGTVLASADRLVVDAECIYWVEESGARIMRRSK